MNIKLKKHNQDGIVRVESSGQVKEVMINEDFLHPQSESISVCFAGKNSSGIVDFTPAEIDVLLQAVRERAHLIKGVKVFKEKR